MLSRQFGSAESASHQLVSDRARLLASSAMVGGVLRTLVEDDAGGGASVVRARGRNWYVENQALESAMTPK